MPLSISEGESMLRINAVQNGAEAGGHRVGGGITHLRQGHKERGAVGC